MPPEELPLDFKKAFLLIWANNGDRVSHIIISFFLIIKIFEHFTFR